MPLFPGPPLDGAHQIGCLQDAEMLASPIAGAMSRFSQSWPSVWPFLFTQEIEQLSAAFGSASALKTLFFVHLSHSFM